MSLIDLAPFCSRPEENRCNLERPWSRGKWTFASDGRILVRIPRDADIPENEYAPSAIRLFTAPFKTAHHFQPLIEVPSEGVTTVRLGPRRLNAHYLRLIAALPNAEFAVDSGTAADALAFRFASRTGHGIVMPIRDTEG